MIGGGGGRADDGRCLEGEEEVIGGGRGDGGR